MVRRSKGCITCVRRKVRCDEVKPACTRCEKAQLSCEGYAREHRFIDEGARTVRYARQDKDSKPPPASITRDAVPFSSKRQGLLPVISLAGFQDNVIISFLLSHIFDGVPTQPWLVRLAEDHTSVTAQKAIRALSSVYFGKINGQHDILNQGFSHYGDALISLNRDLQDEVQAWSDKTLTNVMSLQLFEFIAFSSSTGWLQHTGGISRLIQLRGPLKHQSPIARFHLEESRATIAMECLIKRKRCFLESPEWKIMPWALDPEAKTPVMYLHDILCSVPGLMEDAAALQNPFIPIDEFLDKHQKLSNQIDKYFAELHAWRSLWEEMNPHACFEVLNPVQGSIFPTILHYTALLTAGEISTYNSILLVLHQLGNEISGPSFMPSMSSLTHNSRALTPSNPLHLLSSAPTRQDIAREICRSADYHLLESQNSAGSYYLLFPLRVAYQAFGEADGERMWLRNCMQRVAAVSGWEIARHLGSDAASGLG